MTDPSSEDPAFSETAGGPSLLDRLDEWMTLHPFHPRFLPFVVYVVFLWIAMAVTDFWPAGYPVIYTIQCVVVAWLLWRYRGLMPELTLRFHWVAVPIGVIGAAAWMGLAVWMERISPAWFGYEAESFFDQMGVGVASWSSMGLRLAGMALIVPMFEELVFRSALLRGLHRPKTAWIAFVQLLEDLPIIGDWVMQTETSKRFDKHRRPLAEAFERVPLGALSWFGVLIGGGVLWCLLSHMPRDWPGTIACGLLYAFVVWYTNRPEKPTGPKLGLGPVIWAHGITNAILWAYTLRFDDWRFL